MFVLCDVMVRSRESCHTFLVATLQHLHSAHTHFRVPTMEVHLLAGAFLLLVLTISGESLNHSLVELRIKGFM